MYIRLLEVGKNSETYNICSGKVFSIRQILSTLQILSNHRLNVIQNPLFMRPNEIKRLCGDPNKINSLGRDFSSYSIQETLEWMLNN
jgi:UDP-glucose 4-epimerase